MIHIYNYLRKCLTKLIYYKLLPFTSLTLILLLYSLFYMTSLHADEVQKLRQKIFDMEQDLQLIKERQEIESKNTARASEESNMAQDIVLDLEQQSKFLPKISGYADVEVKSSTNQDKDPSVGIHHFSLFFTKQFNEQWKLFAEIEYEDAPEIEFDGETSTCDNCSGKIFLESMNIDYTYNSLINLRMGRFFTPAGIWSIDHYPPFVPTQERPLLIRKIFPQIVDGGKFFGRLQTSNDFFLSYDIYFGNGEGNTGKGDNNTDKAIGLRMNFSMPIFNQFDLGATVYYDNLGDNENKGTEKTVYSFHSKIKMGWFTFQGEYAKGDYTPRTNSEYTKTGYYTQLMANVYSTAFGYRYDYFDNFNNGLAEQQEQIRNTVFMNYKPHKDIVLKLEHHFTDVENNENYNLSIMSIAVNMGSSM